MEPQPLPVEPIVKPQTPFLKIALFSLAGLLLLGGSFYAGYRCANREPVTPAPKEEVSAPPSSEGVTTPPVTKEPTGEWQIYYNGHYLYQVEYPEEGWDTREMIPYTPGTDRVEHRVAFEGEGSIQIDVWTNRTSLDLISWVNEKEPAVVQQGIYIPPQPNTRIAGESAVFVVKPKSIQSSAVWDTIFQRGQKVFQVTYITPYDGGDFELYQHILSTFEFEDTKDIPDILPSKPE
ncbi:hypothetical protein L6258_01895 [Candidatus Parcubacteria bacterium]|nr:hypothetical protein [Candidatus Parcubacteria bacterium]